MTQKKIKNQADEDLANAKEELEDKRSKTEKSIEKLGNAKLSAYSGSLEKFYNCYTQISKANRNHLSDLQILFLTKM